MTEHQTDPGNPPTPATPQESGTAPAPVPAAPGPDIAGNIKRLPLAEKLVVGIALLVELGWVITWSQTGGWEYQGLSQWFPLLSFFGALVVVVLVVLKVLGVKFLPSSMEKHAVPVASLLPVLGFVIQSVISVSVFLTVVGSLAMAYVSATAYWRKHMPVISEK